MMTDSKRALIVPVLPQTLSFDSEIVATKTTQSGGNILLHFVSPVLENHGL